METREAPTDPRDAYERLLARVEQLTAEVPSDVRARIAEAATSGIDAATADRMLARVLAALLRWADESGDRELADHLRLHADALRDDVRQQRSERSAPAARVNLQSRHGIPVHRVIPPPTFNGREVKVWAGYLPAAQIEQWDGNERLQIHIEQFTDNEGRGPNGDEILQIMLTKMSLAGLDEAKADEFEIAQLARSIARNCVRIPVIIDHRGRLLDGNRRLAACRFVLAAPEYGLEAKERAEWVPVWQLEEGTTDEESDHVVITLNFEDKTKKEWPKYVRANKVAHRYDRAARLEPGRDKQRERALRREIAEYFGISTNQVSSYLKMVGLANEFEDHQVHQRGRDPHAVAHKASAYFEYFDELSKGEASGVHFFLKKDDELRKLVFDLLYEDKFVRFSQIRHLKHLSEAPEAMAELRRARDEKDMTPERLEEVQQNVDDALTTAAAAAKERKLMDPNTRIQNFVAWLKAVPVSTFQEKVDTENLVALRDALALANNLVEPALIQRGRQA